MSRFNKKPTKIKDSQNMLCGGKNLLDNSEMELYSMVCAGTLSPTYYTPDTNDTLNRIRAKIRKLDPMFVAQLAVYVRENMNLRTLPLILTVELAKCHNGDNLIRRLTKRVIQRADEITELLAYYVKANNNEPIYIKEKNGHRVEKTLYKISKQIEKGLKDVFESGKFNEYNFAKYNSNKDIKLRDALFLTHPKPKNGDMREIFKKIANNSLDTPYTWETKLSEAGQKGKSKKEAWEELIYSGKMGYMAMLRNIRNFLKEDVSEDVLQIVINKIGNPEEIKKSKQLPFRFLSAYRSLKSVDYESYYSYRKLNVLEDIDHKLLNVFLKVFEKAALISASNMSIFDDKILMAIDVSASMITPISERSSVYHYDIGALMAFLANAKCKESTVGMFGDSWKVIDNINKDYPIKSVNNLYRREGEVGYSTNGYKVIEYALNEDIKFDKIMMFTDCQMYGYGNSYGGINSLWKRYNETYPKSKLYLFNLSGYGQSPLEIRENVFLISGWSNSIFDVLKNIENGEKNLEMIRKVVL